MIARPLRCEIRSMAQTAGYESLWHDGHSVHMCDADMLSTEPPTTEEGRIHLFELRALLSLIIARV